MDIRNIDVAAASPHAILVTQASAGFMASVSKWIVGVMIDASRHISSAALHYRIDLTPTPVMGRELPQRQALIASLPGKVVIDHTGKFLEPVPVTDLAFKALLAVPARGQRWVKVSAPREPSRLGPPHHGDVAVSAQALLQAHPDRCPWASNWPHPNRMPVPADANMLALLGDWAVDDTRLRDRVQVGNPAALYGF